MIFALLPLMESTYLCYEFAVPNELNTPQCRACPTEIQFVQ